MATRFCETCGHRFRAGVRFCGGCGTPVPADDPPAADAPPVPAAATGQARPSSVAPKLIGGLVAALLVLFSVFGSESRRETVIRFIDRNLYEPVEAVTPRNTIGEFYGRVRLPCRDFLLVDDCPSNHPIAMLFRVPGAIAGTAGYVLSQGPVAIAVVGIPTLVFFGFLIAAVSDDLSRGQGLGAYFNPYAWIFTWLVAFPLFTGLFAWAIQLLILALLLMLKSVIAALAFIGIGYVLFEKLKLWDESRRLIERGANRLTPRRSPRQAGP